MIGNPNNSRRLAFAQAQRDSKIQEQSIVHYLAWRRADLKLQIRMDRLAVRITDRP